MYISKLDLMVFYVTLIDYIIGTESYTIVWTVNTVTWILSGIVTLGKSYIFNFHTILYFTYMCII